MTNNPIINDQEEASTHRLKQPFEHINMNCKKNTNAICKHDHKLASQFQLHSQIEQSRFVLDDNVC